MIDFDKIMNDILTEWSSRVHNGQPDKNNPMHLIELQRSLYQLGYGDDIVDTLLQNLREVGEKPLSDKDKEKARKMGLVSLGYGNWGKEKGGKTTHKNVDGKLVAVGGEEPEEKKDRLDADDFKSTFEKDKEDREEKEKEVSVKGTPIKKKFKSATKEKQIEKANKLDDFIKKEENENNKKSITFLKNNWSKFIKRGRTS